MSGKPADDPQVEAMLEHFLNYLLEKLDLQSYQELEQIFKMDLGQKENQEKIDQYLEEMDKLFYIPLTTKEEAWLGYIIEQYNREG
ncbi:hypothetical protein [Gracilibacillus salinarum]|uniref:CdiI immunity protein domain-containing protein n=1 Tax=Gracilibacillus salinarum TaxID=2932255 RepID=A0ABY4GHJ9_9BACI|nr:hypothetical protein [Gracilibacillus salinarum]UOQ83701.1 hypothetical protein MUN87_13150 [Gracilibacillus salinarum]